MFSALCIVEEEDMTRDRESELWQAEGTSLLHISFAVKHDLVSKFKLAGAWAVRVYSICSVQKSVSGLTCGITYLMMAVFLKALKALEITATRIHRPLLLN